jgi:hypothetical protein
MLARFLRSHSRPASLVRRERRPCLEALEGRQLMSLGAVFGPINSTSAGDMFGSAGATAADSSSVVAWIYQPNPANFADVYVLAQRYNSFGSKIGPQILVAFSGTVGANPSVAMDDEG